MVTCNRCKRKRYDTDGLCDCQDCLACGEAITLAEAERNDGLCWRCAKEKRENQALATTGILSRTASNTWSTASGTANYLRQSLHKTLAEASPDRAQVIAIALKAMDGGYLRVAWETLAPFKIHDWHFAGAVDALMLADEAKSLFDRARYVGTARGLLNELVKKGVTA